MGGVGPAVNLSHLRLLLEGSSGVAPDPAIISRIALVGSLFLFKEAGEAAAAVARLVATFLTMEGQRQTQTNITIHKVKLKIYYAENLLFLFFIDIRRNGDFYSM